MFQRRHRCAAENVAASLLLLGQLSITPVPAPGQSATWQPTPIPFYMETGLTRGVRSQQLGQNTLAVY